MDSSSGVDATMMMSQLGLKCSIEIRHADTHRSFDDIIASPRSSHQMTTVAELCSFGSTCFVRWFILCYEVYFSVVCGSMGSMQVERSVCGGGRGVPCVCVVLVSKKTESEFSSLCVAGGWDCVPGVLASCCCWHERPCFWPCGRQRGASWSRGTLVS